MSQAEKMQQAEEQHASEQLSDAELEAIRIKIDAEEGFNNLQTHGQSAEAQEAREKVESLLAEEAKEGEAQKVGIAASKRARSGVAVKSFLQKLLF